MTNPLPPEPNNTHLRESHKSPGLVSEAIEIVKYSAVLGKEKEKIDARGETYLLDINEPSCVVTTAVLSQCALRDMIGPYNHNDTTWAPELKLATELFLHGSSEDVSEYFTALVNEAAETIFHLPELPLVATYQDMKSMQESYKNVMGSELTPSRIATVEFKGDEIHFERHTVPFLLQSLTQVYWKVQQLIKDAINAGCEEMDWQNNELVYFGGMTPITVWFERRSYTWSCHAYTVVTAAITGRDNYNTRLRTYENEQVREVS